MAILPSGLLDVVADEEPLARFVHERNKFNSSGAKPAAFIPPPNAALSVARHSGEPLDELRALAHEYLEGKLVYGAAFLTAGDVRDLSLDVLAEEPPPRHANIVGWPNDPDPDLRKARRKYTALKLASMTRWLSLQT